MPEGKKNTKKKEGKRKTAIGIIVFVSVFILLTTVIALLYLDDFIRKQITTSIVKASRGQYHLQIGELDAEIWTGNVRMKKVRLIQDKKVLEKLRKQTSENYADISINAEKASIRNFKWINYLISNNLKVGKIKLTEPELVVEGTNLSQSIKSTDKNLIELLPGIIAGFAGSLKIAELEVKSGKVRYDVKTNKGLLSQKAEDIFIDINDIEIDTFSTRQFLYSKDIKFQLKNYSLRSENQSDKVDIAEIKAALQDSVFEVNGFKLQKKPDLKQPSYFHADNLTGEGVNFKSFFYSRQIKMREVNINNPSIELETDAHSDEKTKSGKAKQTHQKGIFVPDYLSEILKSFDISIINIWNGKIRNNLYTNDSKISQKADSVNISLHKISGKTSDSLYMTRPEEISINLKNYEMSSDNPVSHFSIKSLAASTSTGIFQLDKLALSLLDTTDKKNKLILNQTAEFIKGDGFDYNVILDEQKIYFKNILIYSPVTTGTFVNEKKKSKAPASGSFLPAGLPDEFTRFIKSFSIAQTKIEKASINFSDKVNSLFINHRFEDLELSVTNLGSYHQEESLHFDNISLRFNNYTLKEGSQNFTLNLGPTEINSADSTGNFSKVKIIQDHPPGIERNHFTVTIPQIKMEKLDLKRLLYNSQVYTEKVKVYNLKADFLIHVGKGARPLYAVYMPNEIARKLPVYINMRQVDFSNAIITQSDATGKVHTFLKFENSQARALNITNDPSYMSEKTPAIMQFKTEVMGKGKLEAKISVPLLSADFNGHYMGKINGTDATVFNELLQISDIRLQSGIIDSAYFNITISKGVSNGNLTFLYHDLDLDLLKKDGYKNNLKSLLGNFVAKDSNPKKPGKEPESVTVGVKRDENDSFFFFLWRPLLEGIVKTVTKDKLLPEGFTQE